jgi:hypothetical protein
MSFILLGVLNSQETAVAAGAYDLLETVLISSNTTDVTFSSIPQTYSHLQVRMTVRNSSSFNTAIRVRPNSDSALNYYTHRLRGYGSGILSNAAADTGRLDQLIITSTATASVFGSGVLDLLDYKNTNKYKTFRSLHGYADPLSAGASIQLCSIQYRDTSAITSLTLNCWDGNFVSGSRFSLYGIKG